MIKLTKILQEIGEGGRPYEWGIDLELGEHVQYGFETDTNSEYQVYFESVGEGETWDVSFAAREIGGSSSEFSADVITNKGDVYKVMSTVSDIVKDFINDHEEVLQLKFDPSQTGDDPTTKDKRAKLYMAYFKKQMPTSKMHPGAQGEFVIQL